MSVSIPDNSVTKEDLIELPKNVSEYYYNKMLCVLKPVGIRKDRTIIWESIKESNCEK